MTEIIRPDVGFVLTPTTAPVVTAGIYSAKDVVGQMLTFANAVRQPGGKSKINTLVLTDLAFVANVLELWLFDRVFASPIADNGVFDIADGELAYCVGVIPIAAADYFQATDDQVAVVRNVGLEFTLAYGTILYAQCKCVGTPTYASVADINWSLAGEYLS